mgnify:FL=1
MEARAGEVAMAGRIFKVSDANAVAAAVVVFLCRVRKTWCGCLCLFGGGNSAVPVGAFGLMRPLVQ